jgi:hypothetical protein
MRGMEVAFKIEKVGSSTGQPSAVVRIRDSGELPLLRHIGGRNGSRAGSEDDAAEDVEDQLQ